MQVRVQALEIRKLNVFVFSAREQVGHQAHVDAEAGGQVGQVFAEDFLRRGERRFAGIAPGYDRWAQLLSFGQDSRWHRRMIDGWHEFENKATEKALREWCALNSLEIKVER